jgi:hypothetical protein
MRFIPALIGAGLIGGVATAVVAQTTPAPTTPATNPNTKVYAYHKTSPAKAKTNALIEQRKADETPPHGTFKWWEMQSRFSGGTDGGGP